jgi:hypothetical protein
MNQTIFTKLRLDGAAVTADELAEPFDVIVPAGRVYEAATAYQRKRPPVALSGVVFHEGVSADGLTSTDLLSLALAGGTGSNKDFWAIQLTGVGSCCGISARRGALPALDGRVPGLVRHR